MKHEQEFLDDVRQVLDESVDNLDAGTRSRLARARHAALEAREAKEKRGERRLRWVGLPAAGLAVAAVAALLVLNVFDPRGTGAPEDFVADLEVLGAEESTEFYEDLDFYLWISEEGLDEKRTDTPGDDADRVAAVGHGARDGVGGAAERRVSRIPRHARG
jgi:hypothetical protein